MGNDTGMPLASRRRPRRPPLGEPEPAPTALRLKRQSVTPILVEDFGKPKPKLRHTAVLAMALWALLWMGYNADANGWTDPYYPYTTMDWVHGIRAFFPMLAGWFALLCVLVRSKKAFSWMISPLGLMLLYAITGLVSSAIYSPGPIMALYYCANYLALVLVLLAIVIAEDPLADLMYVLKFTWVVGILLTLSLLGIIPFLGSGALTETTVNPVGEIAYSHVITIAGMQGSRNTGFARYAAIATLVALCGCLRKGSLRKRAAWAIICALSLYALVLANGRTETVAFIASLAVALAVDRTKRLKHALIGLGVTVLLGLRGFYNLLYQYITRGNRLDVSMTGRTNTWKEGWDLFSGSPWLGYGFQADHYYLGQHMHNAFLHALVQSGLVGGGAILIGLLIVWIYLIKYFFVKQPVDTSLIPAEIPAVFMFVMLSSFLESTFAYYSAAWLLSAPIVGYVLALHQHQQKLSAKAQDGWTRSVARRPRVQLSQLEDAPSSPAIPIAG